MDNGKTMSTIMLGLKPAITAVNRRNVSAMELRDARMPCTVDNNPIKAINNTGSEIMGVRKTPSTVEPHENNGSNVVRKLDKY